MLKNKPHLIQKAFLFAYAAHAGQKRKYTGEKYIFHPEYVAMDVSLVTEDEEVIAAALLHDVVEDTPITLDEIELLFGDRVAQLVGDVTDVSKPEDGNRATRKAIDREHLAKASNEGKIIKLADLIDNSSSITRYDPKFAKVYMREMRDLLEALRCDCMDLWNKAQYIVNDYFETCT